MRSHRPSRALQIRQRTLSETASYRKFLGGDATSSDLRFNRIIGAPAGKESKRGQEQFWSEGNINQI